MFKFLAKVWMAGEINDYRRDRKKRKIEQKRIKRERRIRNVAEIGIIDEIVKNDKEKKKEWEDTQNKLVLSSLVFLLSLIISLFFVPMFFVALIDIVYVIVMAFKYEKIKKRNLRR